MGITYIKGRVRGPTGREETLEFLIDSGAIYSLLPEAVWKAIELEPKREMEFALADNTKLKRQVSECQITLSQGESNITLPQGEIHTPVILGQAGDAALLGVVTLEELGLVFNPFSRTLWPMRMMLA